MRKEKQLGSGWMRALISRSLGQTLLLAGLGCALVLKGHRLPPNRYAATAASNTDLSRHRALAGVLTSERHVCPLINSPAALLVALGTFE